MPSFRIFRDEGGMLMRSAGVVEPAGKGGNTISTFWVGPGTVQSVNVYCVRPAPRASALAPRAAAKEAACARVVKLLKRLLGLMTKMPSSRGGETVGEALMAM